MTYKARKKIFDLRNEIEISEEEREFNWDDAKVGETISFRKNGSTYKTEEIIELYHNDPTTKVGRVIQTESTWLGEKLGWEIKYAEKV